MDEEVIFKHNDKIAGFFCMSDKKTTFQRFLILFFSEPDLEVYCVTLQMKAAEQNFDAVLYLAK